MKTALLSKASTMIMTTMWNPGWTKSRGHGPRRSYGQLISRDTIIDGDMTLSTAYYPDAHHPKSVTPYVNGQIEGQRKTFLPSGDPDTVETWVGGKQQGETLVYRNGEKIASIPYVAGLKDGKEIRYRDGEQVAQDISWVKGQQHGRSNVYVGDTVATTWWHRGNQVSQSAYELKNKD